MAKFGPAVEKVLLHEGGYVWNPLDRGGETNWGITRKTYESYIGGPAGVNAMKNLPKGNAIRIYKDNYWDKVRGDKIKSYSIAFALFDQAVNRGVSRSLRQAQMVLGIYPDGIMDDEMLKRINYANEEDFLDDFINRSETAYRNIVAGNPSQATFLRGWLKRVDSLREYTDEHLGERSAGWLAWTAWSAIVLGAVGAGYYAYTFGLIDELMQDAGGSYARNPKSKKHGRGA